MPGLKECERGFFEDAIASATLLEVAGLFFVAERFGARMLNTIALKAGEGMVELRIGKGGELRRQNSFAKKSCHGPIVITVVVGYNMEVLC
ncbi:hypothetical protein BP6252_05837 [Coleophoma cylindrospora]|uniref:Uncharacterized protein n=1 Tax=Coleophoma cylindrospora TaxID=1849047 RepID=A0A3D8RV94_9HELO|nr:hypothetical protein BP6252_05837 [Coleophoma cylindrospora]